MPATKVTLLFNHGTIDSAGQAARSAGHSESYYSDLAIDNPSLLSIWNTLCIKRAALLPANVRIIGSRYQRVDPRGASKSFDTVYPSPSSALNDLPNVALQWTIRAAATFNQRSLILPGIPDGRVVTGEYSPSAAYNAALIDFFTHLRTNWRFRAKDRTKPKVKIASVAAGNGLVTTVGPHSLVVNDHVNVQSTVLVADSPNPPKLTYQATVIAPVTANTLTIVLDGRRGFPDPSVFGTIQLDSVIYPVISISDNEVINPTVISRKVGSPFRKFRGRRTRNH